MTDYHVGSCQHLGSTEVYPQAQRRQPKINKRGEEGGSKRKCSGYK